MNIALGDEPKNNDFEGNENFMAFDAFVANDKQASSVSDHSESSQEDDSNEDDNLQTAYNKLFSECMKYEKISRRSLKKLKKVELKKEALKVKLDEAKKLPQLYKAKNFSLVDKIKGLECELVQSRSQLERLSSIKLDHVLNSQKPISNKTGLGYIEMGPSTPSISKSSSEKVKIDSIPPPRKKDIKTEQAQVDKGKQPIGVVTVTKPILESSPRKKIKGKFVPTCHHCGVVDFRPNHSMLRTQTKPKSGASPRKEDGSQFAPICHHYSFIRHTHPNCFKLKSQNCVSHPPIQEQIGRVIKTLFLIIQAKTISQENC